jgi:ABC-2 type transport system ATP-binding protein
MNPILKLSNVKKYFSNFTLGSINFELEYGKVLALVGPNGAGKTTTMDCISGILQPNTGDIEICGKKTNPKDKSWKYFFGYVCSEPVFINTMTGKEFLNYVSKYYPKWNTELMNKLISVLEFNPDEKIHKLSTGNKTKLEIISAISTNPYLLLLDEPTNNLDPIIRDRFIDVIFDFMSDDEHSVMWSTHIIPEVSHIADEFAFLNVGKFCEISSKIDLIENWRRIIVNNDSNLQNDTYLAEINPADNNFEIFTCKYDETLEFLKNNNIEIINDYYMNIESICLKNLQKYKNENF